MQVDNELRVLILRELAEIREVTFRRRGSENCRMACAERKVLGSVKHIESDIL